MHGDDTRVSHAKLSGNRELRIVVLTLAACLCALSTSNIQAQSSYLGSSSLPKRPATVSDAICMTRMVGLPQFSPNGKSVVVVLRRGNLNRNTNEYSLVMWSIDEGLHFSNPDVLVSMSSDSNREAINTVTWMSDDETLVFLGENPHELQQIYALNTRTKALRKLTSHSTNILRYSVTPRQDRSAFLAEEPIRELVDHNVRRDGVVISTQRLTDLLAGKNGLDDSGKVIRDLGQTQILVSDAAGPRRLSVRDRISKWGQFAISPNGNYIVAQAYVEQFPRSWLQYSDPYLHEFIQQQLMPGQISFITRFILIDASTGDSRILLNSPVTTVPTSIAWSPDSGSLLLAGVYLPVDDPSRSSAQAITSKTFVVEISVLSNEVIKVADEDEISHHFSRHSTRSIKWDVSAGRAIYVLHNWQTAAELRICFQKNGDEWKELKDSGPTNTLPTVLLDQDMNRPPKLFGLDPRRHEETLLLDLNPQFVDFNFGRVEEMEWKGSDGHDVKGGLYYPVGYVKGKRYPLVIQSHGWNSKEFWIDGPYSTGFAAQALAGQGIMVLQADEIWYGPDFDTPREVHREVATFEGAIDTLNNRRLIDQNRVGIIGFSRTGMFLAFALIQAKYNFAAASVADSSDMGFFEAAVAANAAPEAIATLKRFYGGLPYGLARKAWLDGSPEFNWDKVKTPLRMLSTGPEELMGMWGWFAPLLMLGKPVEMTYLPEGTHVLQKPWEQMVSQQGNVDWFSFWLRNKEDSDLAKAAQYARWRKLRTIVDIHSR